MPSATSQERKVANAAGVNSGSNSNPPPSNNQQISKSGSIDTPMTPLQQVLVMVDKKVRNLDKRKVSESMLTIPGTIDSPTVFLLIPVPLLVGIIGKS